MDPQEVGLFLLTPISISVAAISGALIGAIYLRHLDTSPREVIYHCLVFGLAFFLLMSIVRVFESETAINRWSGIGILWIIFSLSAHAGVSFRKKKGGGDDED